MLVFLCVCISVCCFLRNKRWLLLLLLLATEAFYIDSLSASESLLNAQLTGGLHGVRTYAHKTNAHKIIDHRTNAHNTIWNTDKCSHAQAFSYLTSERLCPALRHKSTSGRDNHLLCLCFSAREECTHLWRTAASHCAQDGRVAHLSRP